MNRLFIFLVLGIFFTFPMDAQIRYLAKDTVIFGQFLQYAQQGDNSLIHTARFFLNTPYVGGTLEGDSVEQLRINLHELDCVTFVESALALHLMLQSDQRTFVNFCRIMQQIRYRNGIIDGYLSRLHYFSEWLNNNRQMGIITLPAIPGCQEFIPAVSFMSMHCDNYPALKKNPDWCKQIVDVEKNIQKLKLCYIPKEQVKDYEKHLQSGDIISITTHIQGLDTSHTGFVMIQNGRAYLLHASSEAHKVVISDETLHEYLANRKNNSGIMVGRLN